MASMREIKRRRSSISSTQQITKAMKLVSTVKLQKARTRTENSKAYFEYMYKTVTSMLEKAGNIDHPYLKKSTSDNIAVVAVTSNRGLAGGYNANIVRMIDGQGFDKEKVKIYTVGNKGYEGLARKGYKIVADYSEVIEEPAYVDAKEISERLLEDFSKGEIGEIYLAYTEFKNTVVQIPKLIKLLPVEKGSATKAGLNTQEKNTAGASATGDGGADEKKDFVPMNFEPNEEETISLLIPKYMTSMLYGAFVESVASENGARMQAMESATNNAQEIIDELGLLYNQARQSAITQELTEIIAGAGAIE